MMSYSPLKIALCAALPLLAAACSNVYELPDPPPPEQRHSVSLIPGEDERRREKDFQEARANVLKLADLVQSKRFEEALGLMSQETVAMLEFVSPDKNSSAPATAVFTMKLVVVDGVSRPIDPKDALLAPDLSEIVDTVEGQQENESPRRKELFALQEEGAPRKIVMIKEGDTWLLHRTRLDAQR